MQGKAGTMKAEDIQLATAGGMRFMVVYYVPGSVLAAEDTDRNMFSQSPGPQ